MVFEDYSPLPHLKEKIFWLVFNNFGVVSSYITTLNWTRIWSTCLQNQVKFQAQVNGEVKKLLVAAVGEDIETRVQSLTEDKLHLTKQLLKTAKTLSTHQEQIEWLAGQGEVWRSKFLASRYQVPSWVEWLTNFYFKIYFFFHQYAGRRFGSMESRTRPKSIRLSKCFKTCDERQRYNSSRCF